MKKKIYTMGLMFLLVLSMIPMVFAENETTSTNDTSTTLEVTTTTLEDATTTVETTTTQEATTTTLDDGDDVEDDVEEVENVDDETATEAETMTSAKGAEMRLLQLERAITRSIISGNVVIEYLNEKEVDTTDLQLILAELEQIKSDVQSADPLSETAVETFVDLKKDSNDLVREFREKTRELVPAGERDEIMKEIADADKSDLEELTEEIQSARRAHNAERFRKYFEIMGEDSDAIVEKVADGTMTLGEAQKMVREKFAKMTKDEKKEVFAEIKVEGTKKALKTKNKLDKVKVNILDRQEKRIQERLEKVAEKNPKLAEKVQKKTQERLQKISVAKEKLKEKIEARKERAENVAGRVAENKPQERDSGNLKARGGRQ